MYPYSKVVPPHTPTPVSYTHLDALVVPTAGMGTGQGQGTEGLDVTVLADIKMIACAGEAPAQVVCRQVVLRIAAVSYTHLDVYKRQ